VMLFVALFPVVWIFSASVNPSNSLVNQQLIPARPTLDNYTNLLFSEMFPFRTWMLNSLKLGRLRPCWG
jgi:ABC-type maltose transport system permease subunit